MEEPLTLVRYQTLSERPQDLARADGLRKYLLIHMGNFLSKIAFSSLLAWDTNLTTRLKPQNLYDLGGETVDKKLNLQEKSTMPLKAGQEQDSKKKNQYIKMIFKWTQFHLSS